MATDCKQVLRAHHARVEQHHRQCHRGDRTGKTDLAPAQDASDERVRSLGLVRRVRPHRCDRARRAGFGADPVGVGRGTDDAFLIDVVAREVRRRLPLAQDDHPIAHADQFRQLRRDQDDREALSRKLRDHRVDLGLALHVDALRRLVEDEQAGVRRQPFGQHDLLLVAARQGLHRLVEAAELETQAAQMRFHERQLAAPHDEPRHRRPADHRQRGIGQDGKVQDEALAEPILRKIGDAGFHRRRRIGKGDRLAGNLDAPGTRLVDAEEDAGDLGPPAADETGEAQDLAGADLERDALKRVIAREALDRENRFADLRVPFRVHRAQRPPDHQLHGAIAVEVAGDLDRHQTAIAQDRDAVGNPVDLLHPVADEHHRHLPRLEVCHHGEQALDLALRQGGRRLVHDQDLRIGRQRAGDLDELLLGGAKLLQQIVGAARQADGIQERLCRRAHPVPVDAERAARHVADEDVLEDREIAEQAWMLVHHRDATALRLERRPALDRCAVDQDHPAVGPMHPCQQLDAGALAGTVLAEQGQDLARQEVERGVLERHRAAEAFSGVAEAGHCLAGRGIDQGRAHIRAEARGAHQG